jgi:hypothetical protein
MTYEPAQPRYTLTLAGKSYDLIATFGMIDACEAALNRSIISIASGVFDLPARDMAKLICAMIGANGQKLSHQDAGFALMDMGIGSSDYAAFCLEVYAFLSIALAKPEAREGIREKMGKLKGKVSEPSRGTITNDSATAL